MNCRYQTTGVRQLINALWKLFGFLGALLGLRRWWRTLRDKDEDAKTRMLALVLLVGMFLLIVLSTFGVSHRFSERSGARRHAGEYARVADHDHDGEARELKADDDHDGALSDPEDANEVVVDFHDGLSATRIAALGQRYGVKFHLNSPMSKRANLMIADVSQLNREAREAMVAELRADTKDVDAADFNGMMTLQGQRIGEADEDEVASTSLADQPRGSMTPNDPRYPEQWNFALIGMPQAWEKADGEGAVVAVVDTGCAFEPGEGYPAASDLKGTKWVRGYDFVSDTDRAYDDMGHGTHCAGTIAQTTNNGYGVAGIAYKATIMPIKVLSHEGSGTYGDIADGINFAADHGANIISMSLGGPRGTGVLAKAMRYANQRGVTIICAAGNSGRRGVGYPAAYPEAIAVAACGPDRESSFYTSYGPQVAIAAPGGNYRSKEDQPTKGVLQNTVFEKNDGFEYWQGTSMATPHVAGVAALLVSQGVKTPAAIRDQLTKTATKMPGADPEKYGAGVLDAAAAVGAKSASTASAPVEPTTRSASVKPATTDHVSVMSVREPRTAAALIGLFILLATTLALGLGSGWGARTAFFAGGLGSLGLLSAVSFGVRGCLALGVASTAIWPLALLVVLFGVKRLRPVLTGVCAGYAAAAVGIGAMGCGPTTWLVVNAVVSGALALLATRAMRTTR